GEFGPSLLIRLGGSSHQSTRINMKATPFALLAAAMVMGASAHAADLEKECLEVSEMWGSTGDVAAQCACIVEQVGGDATLTEEMMGFRDAYSNDAEAYEGASDAAKAAMDACAVES
ncbi:MAG: hypothetical protein AAGL49_13245, partial [Pseudomonadota bacterium]